MVNNKTKDLKTMKRISTAVSLVKRNRVSICSRMAESESFNLMCRMEAKILVKLWMDRLRPGLGGGYRSLNILQLKEGLKN